MTRVLEHVDDKGNFINRMQKAETGMGFLLSQCHLSSIQSPGGSQ